MTSSPTPVPCSFSWLALSTSDPKAAAAFYGQLFGWSVIDAPVGSILVSRSGGPVGSLLDHKSQNRFAEREPVNWLPFIRVTSAATTARALSQAGGRVWVEPYSVGSALVSVVRGASGEAFGLWQSPVEEGGTPLLNDPDACAWFELASRDPDAAAAFYRRLFSWRIADEGGYTFLGNEVGQFGGIVRLAGDWEDWAFMAAIGRAKGEKLEVPPHWMIFFAVDDCDAFVAEAEEIGALVMTHSEPLHTIGTMAILRDPQGVYFSVLSKR